MGGSMPKIVNDSKESAFTTRQRRSKAKFVVTKQSSWPGAATRPDKRRCFFLMAPPKCCSSCVATTLPKKCPTTSRVECRRSRTSRFYIEQRFENYLATKSSSKDRKSTRLNSSHRCISY